jgi:6-phospho-3-hexuloisomerase
MVSEIVKSIIENVGKILSEVDENEVKKFIEKIKNSKNIFVVGAGRSGLVVKAFAMRLMHLGFNVFVVGETITPSVKSSDLVIAVSGSGKTTSTLAVAKTAKDFGVSIISVTSYENSPLSQLSDCTVKIRGRGGLLSDDYTSRQLTGEHEPLSPLGTLFEISAMVFLDSVITELMKIYNKKEKDLSEKHANLE